jgi:thiol-disulfide isomerase/thioredoxin
MRRFPSVLLALGLVALASCLGEPESSTPAAKKANLVKVGSEVGNRAPEIASENLVGNPVRLTDLRGKIVVLDFWATWCKPCRDMIPDSRKLVERFKDEPFVLVSISIDDKKDTLTAFLANNNMPWTHWWNGPGGSAIEAYKINGIPAIFVLDADGIIRYHNIRGKSLEKAVDTLLSELPAK